MKDVALRTVDLSIGYRMHGVESSVLSGLNVGVLPGELVCLLGPNGSGKSTLLRTMSGLQPPLRGVVEVGGCDLRRLRQPDLARKIGVVLTERVSVGAMRGRQLVELGRYPHTGWTGHLESRDQDVVSWALETAGASALADRDINKLSDGERQRLMIARAMAQEPLILILDEPTAFLDVASRVELMGLLRALAREEHVAIIISTHDLELALRMADTTWLVMPGGGFHSGVPEDVILSGYVEMAFRADSISFNSEDRVFRPVSEARAQAMVLGEGLNAALARVLLEREGYSIVKAGPATLTVVVESVGRRWRTDARGVSQTGEDFAALARLAKALLPDQPPSIKECDRVNINRTW